MPQKSTKRSSNSSAYTDNSGANFRTRRSLDMTRRVPELDTVQKVIDYYGNHPHNALSKVQEFIDENPLQPAEQSTLKQFEQRFLAGFGANVSDIDQQVQSIKQAQQDKFQRTQDALGISKPVGRQDYRVL